MPSDQQQLPPHLHMDPGQMWEALEAAFEDDAVTGPHEVVRMEC